MEESKYTFYCEDAPQNGCGKTETVDCAAQDLLSKIKTSEDLHLTQLNVGNNCKTDVHVWKYEGLVPFIRAVEDYLSSENKEIAKGNLVEETNKFFGLNSTTDATKIINKLTTEPPFKKEYRNWEALSKEYESIVSGDVGKTLLFGTAWGTVGAMLVEAIQKTVNAFKRIRAMAKDNGTKTELAKEKLIAKNEPKEKKAPAQNSNTETSTRAC